MTLTQPTAVPISHRTFDTSLVSFGAFDGESVRALNAVTVNTGQDVTVRTGTPAMSTFSRLTSASSGASVLAGASAVTA